MDAAGFADPVRDAQESFRAIMDALANPGQAQKLVRPALTAPALAWELVSIVLTLADHDTPVWLDETLRATPGLAQFIGFQTGARMVADAGAADFAFAAAAQGLPRLAAFRSGTQEYPDRSATVVLAVPALSGGADLVLRGPGVDGHIHCNPAGLPVDFVEQWADNRALFPRGVDLLLVGDGQVLGLPRSVRIAEGH